MSIQYLKDNMNVTAALTIFPVLMVLSIIFNSWGVSVSVISCSIATMIILIAGEKNYLSTILYSFSLLAAVSAAFIDNKSYEKAPSMFMLTASAVANPASYGFTEGDREDLMETMVVCGNDGINSAAGIAADLVGVAYEPVEASSFSWIWKQKEPKKECLALVESLAGKSENFRFEVNQILNND